MDISSSASSEPGLAEITQKIYRLRKRFRIIGPENVTAIQEHLVALGLLNSADNMNLLETSHVDIIYNIGIVFSQHQRPVTMGEISREMDIPLSKATRIVDWLVDNEYTERFADPEDRRIVRVRLTPVGQEMYQAINEYFVSHAEQLLSLFSPTDRQTFLSLLGKLLEKAEKGA
jgi:DNA-binding MarR family transcriptional regulator